MGTSEQHAATEERQGTDRGAGNSGLPVIKLTIFVVVATAIAVGAFFGVRAFLLNDDDSEDARRPVAVERGTLLDDVTASVGLEETTSLQNGLGRVRFRHLDPSLDFRRSRL